MNPYAHIALAIKSLKSEIPNWNRQLEEEIANAKSQFRKFKVNVFSAVKGNMHPLGTDGFEECGLD